MDGAITVGTAGGGGGGGGVWVWGGFAWGWGWGAGGLLLGWGAAAALYYNYVIPQQAVTVVYNDYYPYWGYGIAYDDEDYDTEFEISTLAQTNNQWDKVKAQLERLKIKYGQMLTDMNSQYDALADKQGQQGQALQDKIDDLQDKISKVQLHLTGLTKQNPEGGAMNQPQAGAAPTSYQSEYDEIED